MSDAEAVSVQIMDKEYRLACSEDEREALFAAVDYLNRQMREIKGSGKVIGSERIAVMAALNMAHEVLSTRKRSESYSETVESALKRIHNKVDKALTEQPEAKSEGVT